IQKKYLILAGFLFLHLLILSRLQFTAWPEMVSFPYLINHGFVTYRDMVHAYPPLLISTLSVLYKIFGYKILVLKIFGWVTILVSDLLVFLILKKMLKKIEPALYGLFIFVILQPILVGNMVWPDLFIVPFLLLTFLLLFKRKYLFAGIAIGLAILTKQTGVLFLVISGIWLLAYERKNFKSLLNYVLGVLVIVLPFLIFLLKQNAMSDFINWTIIYPSKYWTKFPRYVQLSPTLRENLILLVLLTPLGLLIFRATKKLFVDKTFLLLFGFFICGIVGIYPRFSFFHFQSALAFLVILYFYISNKWKVLFIIPVIVLLLCFKSLQIGEARFWTNEDIKLGQIIQKESLAGEPIYLLGLNSNLYAFADRLPNKPWLDNFGWYLEIAGVQQQVVNSFTNNPPSVIFWRTPDSGSWCDIGTYQPKMITDYIMKNYTRTKEIQKGIWEWKRN